MIKQIIVLRKDLNMRKGKMVAQGAHASMKVFFDRKMDRLGGYRVSEYLEAADGRPEFPEDTQSLLAIPLSRDMAEWVNGAFTKICVGCNSEAELLELLSKAQEAGLPCAAIQDMGATEFHGVPTYTALAIGPADSSKIDPITGHLSLL